MRMSTRTREVLKLAAHKERRTVASLLDKIVTDYLAEAGLLSGSELGAERRESNRKKVTLPAKTFLKTGDSQESVTGVLLDISMGGALLTYPKGSDIKFSSIGGLPQFDLCLEGSGLGIPLRLECESRHMRDTGNDIQIGASFNNLKADDVAALSRYIG